jgi:hypothetical protein
VRGGDTHKQGVSNSFESGEGLSLCIFGKGGNTTARRISTGCTSKVEVGSFFWRIIQLVRVPREVHTTHGLGRIGHMRETIGHTSHNRGYTN